MKIQYHQTNLGKFLKPTGDYSYTTTFEAEKIISIAGIPISEMKPAGNGWYIWQGDLKDFKRSVKGGKIHSGWTLKNPVVQSDVIPLKLFAEALTYHPGDDDDESYFSGKYAEFGSLYSMLWEQQPDTEEFFEVEVERLRDLEIESFNAPLEMKVTLKGRGDFTNEIQVTDLKSIAKFSDIEMMLTPEFLLHTRPCSLSSEQVYKIVRQFILENLDRKQAKISSDYNFIFRVDKILHTKPYSVQREQRTPRGNSYRPPKYKNISMQTKDVPVLEFVWTDVNGKVSHGTKGQYPVIEGWEANSLQELYDNMQTYLQDILEVLNSSMIECKSCGGKGCTIEKIETNKREVV